MTTLKQHLYLTMRHFSLFQATRHRRAAAGTSEKGAAPVCSAKRRLEAPGSGSKSPRTHHLPGREAHIRSERFSPPLDAPRRAAVIAQAEPHSPRVRSRLSLRRVLSYQQPNRDPERGQHRRASSTASLPAEAPQAESRPSGHHTEPAAP